MNHLKQALKTFCGARLKISTVQHALTKSTSHAVSTPDFMLKINEKNTWIINSWTHAVYFFFLSVSFLCFVRFTLDHRTALDHRTTLDHHGIFVCSDWKWFVLDLHVLVLKMRFQVFSLVSKKVQGFSNDRKILMSLLSVLFHIQNRRSVFWHFNF